MPWRLMDGMRCVVGSIMFGSLFAGIGGFDLGFERAGMESVSQSEIDKHCLGVLYNHWPGVMKVEDVRDVSRGTVGAVDLVCGGFPCQDVSVAGKREGLAGERSGFWFEFHRILAELGPRWVVVENVTGLLSSNGGRDFATILRGLVELGYGVCWRVLDAQYLGLAQRRKRVFIVGHLGDGRAAQVLFESEGGCWNPPPSREEGQGVAGDAIQGIDVRNSRGQPDRISGTLQAKKTGGFSLNYINPIAFDYCAQGSERTFIHRKNGIAQMIAGRPDAIAFDRSRSSVSGDISAPLRACGGQAEGVNDGKADVQCVAFAPGNLCRRAGENPSTDDIGTLGAEKQGDMFPHIAFNWQSGGDVRLDCNEYRTGALHANQTPAALTRYGVRRLTPTECERLQGFPDGWTAGQSDTQRYKQLGNAVAVPVAEWIGRRIVEVDGG